jgi:hypothetical protein
VVGGARGAHNSVGKRLDYQGVLLLPEHTPSTTAWTEFRRRGGVGYLAAGSTVAILITLWFVFPGVLANIFLGSIAVGLICYAVVGGLACAYLIFYLGRALVRGLEAMEQDRKNEEKRQEQEALDGFLSRRAARALSARAANQAATGTTDAERRSHF